MGTRRRAAATTLGVALIVALCSGGGAAAGDEIAAFGRGQVDSDRLPGPGSDFTRGFDASSMRKLASVDGVDYFAGRSADDDQYCFVVLGPESQEASACGTSLPLTVGVGALPEAQLTPLPSQPDSEEWTFPAENLAIRKP
jgi:hypothetical protein